MVSTSLSPAAPPALLLLAANRLTMVQSMTDALTLTPVSPLLVLMVLLSRTRQLRHYDGFYDVIQLRSEMDTLEMYVEAFISKFPW